MTNGSSQGLFVIVAVVIFGIFVLISYVLFRDNLKTSLANIFTDGLEQATDSLNGGGTGDVGGSESTDDYVKPPVLNDSFDGDKVKTADYNEDTIILNFKFRLEFDKMDIQDNKVRLFIAPPKNYKFSRDITNTFTIDDYSNNSEKAGVATLYTNIENNEGYIDLVVEDGFLEKDLAMIELSATIPFSKK